EQSSAWLIVIRAAERQRHAPGAKQVYAIRRGLLMQRIEHLGLVPKFPIEQPRGSQQQRHGRPDVAPLSLCDDPKMARSFPQQGAEIVTGAALPRLIPPRVLARVPPPNGLCFRMTSARQVGDRSYRN